MSLDYIFLQGSGTKVSGRDLGLKFRAGICDYSFWQGSGTIVSGKDLGLQFLAKIWDYSFWQGSKTIVSGRDLGLKFLVGFRDYSFWPLTAFRGLSMYVDFLFIYVEGDSTSCTSSTQRKNMRLLTENILISECFHINSRRFLSRVTNLFFFFKNYLNT